MKDDKIKGESLLPDGITLNQLKEYWDVANNEYANVRKRMYLLDGADRSQLWKTITAKFPSYQVLPESNFVNYQKENLLSSIYTVGKSAMLLPRSGEDMDFCNKMNKALDTIWDQLGVYKYQRKAGERAALFNIGITQVGWKNSIIGGTTGLLYKGDVVLKNIDPMKFMRDPYAASDDVAEYMMTWDDFHITKLKSMSVYRDRIKALIKTEGESLGATGDELSFTDSTDRAKNDKASKKYHRVVNYWVRIVNKEGEEETWEVHILNNKYVLYSNKLFFNGFPFSILYCNEPGNDLIGVSEPAKTFSNYIAYNMLNSIMATHAYKAQRPPRFLNMQSGINIRQFTKYGADADKTWLVNGDASEAVHYGKFPELSPTLEMLPARLGFDIKDLSGIDDVYAGKDFGSVTTTGGTDNVITRSTGRDLVKIQLYEEYTKHLTENIIRFFIEYGDDRTYLVKQKMSNAFEPVELSFKDLSEDTKFDYELTIQSELPKNKQRLAQAANILLEKQAQYRPNPEIITIEEWLAMQDIPFKDVIYSRIGIQRNADMTEQVTQILFQFAGLIEQGVEPNQALEMVIQSMQGEQEPGTDYQMMPQEDPGALGNVAGAPSFQDFQEGGEPMMDEEIAI